jgi:hypothetical protein
MASRAALSATYRAIRHVGQIEKDRWQWMATDGNGWQLMATDGS